MLHGFVLLVLFQYGGEALARLAGVPTPGPVIGLAALALLGALWPLLQKTVEPTADALLRHLSLLFVPAGVGVLQHLDLLSAALVPLLAVLVLSTLITMGVTALVFALLARPQPGVASGGEAPR
ncbi:CidA/LrgA family protein [Salinarimonas sp.]|uniref:CidA/LrgA family protein n=1 Tax=Salinarimonas sp. TaxID=2766526 RepID=UPI00391BE502